MKQLFANPTIRLAGRALVAGLISALISLQHSSTGNGTVAWHAAIVAGGLAFAEVFTPLNALVGVFKKKTAHHKQ